MAGSEYAGANVLFIIAVVLVVVGVVIAIFFYFKRSENLSEEDRFNVERVKLAWLAALTIAVLAIIVGKKEWAMSKKSGMMGSGKAASLL